MQSLDDRYGLLDGRVYLSGLQALVRLPLEVRRRDHADGLKTAGFVSGYEGSPLAGYDLELSRNGALLEQHDVVFRPGLNEELAANAVQGSQLAAGIDTSRYDGVTGFWYGKAPGLDRASDALRHANLGGASPTGGAVAIVGDDVTAKSSTVPSASEMGLADLGLPILVPADPQDVLHLGMHAVVMSRFSGLWVALKIATSVADGSMLTGVGTARYRPSVPSNVIDGRPYVHQVSARFLQPMLADLEHTLHYERMELARRYAVANDLNRVYEAASARLGIIVAGSSYLDTREALGLLGFDPARTAESGIAILRLGMVWPLDPATIRSFAAGLDEIVVVEEKRSFVEAAVKEVLYGTEGAPRVLGKRDQDGCELLRIDSALGAVAIGRALARRIPAVCGARLAEGWAQRLDPPRQPRPALTLLPRTPYFCSGCPHNISTRVPDSSLVGFGIGCSGLALLMPADRVGDTVGMNQMGGEGAVWTGMSPFVATPHLIQNMGDGTFHHSGSLAIRAAVAAGTNITYKLLYNSAVAMTGGQAAVGGRSVPDITRMLEAEGVRRIIITTEQPGRYRDVTISSIAQVRHRDELIAAQSELAETAGVTVLIHDQECATELRRKRKRQKAAEPAFRAYINERVCEGCGDCGSKSNCMSVRPVSTEFGRKTQIHQASCNKDFSCLEGDCPSFLTVVPAQRPGTRKSAAELGADLLPEPERSVDSARFALRFTGIGGTGIVTVAQIVAVAAVSSGLFVRAMDQTGLAQKGGAVISDLKISDRPFEESNIIGPGACDLYLGCDLLVAAAADNLATASPERTVAVVSSAEIPTGAMVVDTAAAFPLQEDTLGRIADTTRTGTGRFVDAQAVSIALFGSDQYANVLLLGVAYQLGALPIPSGQIEAAIVLNGVSASDNIQAFRRGRQLIADPAALERALGRTGAAAPSADSADEGSGSPPLPLDELVERRARELTAYQGPGYARSYVEFVERVRTAEARVSASSTELASSVARNLYKLMAYKDEYEVARLQLDREVLADIAATFGAGARYRYRLHPPVLRALGYQNKISLGPWFRHVFALLYALRRLRGTPLDPFGYTHVRRVERELIAEYRETVEVLLGRLDARSTSDAAAIAALPDMIRGYEDIKLANVAQYRKRVASQLAALDTADSAASY